MTRGRVLFFALSLTVVLALLGGNLFGAAARHEGADEDSLYKHLSVFTEVLGLIRQAYVDEPDLGSLMSGALDGTTDALDPFSIYIPGDEVERYLQARGAGTHMSGLTLLKERGVAFVVAVDKGSPAAEAGVEVSDLVSKIHGQSTRTMPLWEVQEQLAAAAGTQVDLELIRVGEVHQVSFELQPFDPLPAEFSEATGSSAAASEGAGDSGGPVGVVRVARFEPATVAAVRQILEQATKDGRDRLLVDLRGVAGGDPEASYAVGELFAAGELGGLERKGDRLQTFHGDGEPVWQGHLVALVSRGTVGAAEILASVLRQKAGAELVGERTFGWAGRQDSADLASGARLFFTDAFYTAPDGEPISRGLEPDLLVDPTRRGFRERDEPLGDLILDKGLERLREMAAAVPDRKAA